MYYPHISISKGSYHTQPLTTASSTVTDTMQVSLSSTAADRHMCTPHVRTCFHTPGPHRERRLDCSYNCVVGCAMHNQLGRVGNSSVKSCQQRHAWLQRSDAHSQRCDVVQHPIAEHQPPRVNNPRPLNNNRAQGGWLLHRPSGHWGPRHSGSTCSPARTATSGTTQYEEH
jgi:hypothetical protein